MGLWEVRTEEMERIMIRWEMGSEWVYELGMSPSPGIIIME
jgi:hypothetical protein